MTRSYYSLAVALVATVALATTTFAATAKAKSITGTLQKIDGQTLTIQTTKGIETVMLMPTAHITSGAQTVTATALTSHAGDRVKVRYTEKNGQKEAQSVTLSSDAQKVDAAKPTQSASATGKGQKK